MFAGKKPAHAQLALQQVIHGKERAFAQHAARSRIAAAKVQMAVARQDHELLRLRRAQRHQILPRRFLQLQHYRPDLIVSITDTFRSGGSIRFVRLKVLGP